MDETASAPAPQLVFELSDGIHHVLNQAIKPRSEGRVWWFKLMTTLLVDIFCGLMMFNGENHGMIR